MILISAFIGKMMIKQIKAKSSRLNLQIDYDLKDKIDEKTEEAGITRTNFVLNAVKVQMQGMKLQEMLENHQAPKNCEE